MRILSIVGRWDGGDVGSHAGALAAGLAARGHDVALLALDEDGSPPREAPPGMTFVPRPRRLLPLLGAYDVVQVHLPLRQAAVVALACRLRGRPLLVSDHRAPRPLAERRLAAASAAAAMRLAAWLTADSRDQAEHAPALLDGARRLTCIVPPLEASGVVHDARLPHAGGMATAPLVAVTGATAWARLAPALRAINPGMRVTDADLDAFTTPDVLVFAPGDVAVPRSLLRALRAGTPVVATDVPAARDVVRRARWHALVPPGRDAAIAAAVADAIAASATPDGRAAADAGVEAGVVEYEALLGRLIARQAAPRRPPVPVRRPIGERPSSLSIADQALVDRLMANEMDLAYRRRARVLLDWLELADGLRVLDCGCGMGFYLLAMGRLRRLRLAGIDVDPGRTDWARRCGVRAGLVRGDFQRLPFAGGTFDRVLLSETLEHVGDDRAALRELYRVLAPGGILAVSVPHVRYPFWWDPLHRLWTATGGAPPRSGPVAGMWSNHERLYWPEDVVERLGEAGFAVERVEEATHFAFPFAHFLVYGIGKPLIEHGLLPERLRRSADRMRGEDNTGSRWNPVNLARAVFRAVDRLNEHPVVARRDSFVNVLVKARRPA